LCQLGYRVESPNNQLPVTIFGSGARAGACRVDLAESSQFASALLLCARAGGWRVEVAGDDAEEAPYVAMTRRLIAAFPRGAGEFQIEADASSASYFCAADWLLQGGLREPGAGTAPRIRVAAFPASDWQIDGAFPGYLPLPAELSRKRQLGDSIMTAMMLAPFAGGPTRFTDLGRLRLQECERVGALRTELSKCGVRVVEQDDSLTIFPAAQPQGAEIETYNDHRVAMCFAILGLKIPGIRIRNPSCVKKTFPNFFQKLAARLPAWAPPSWTAARPGPWRSNSCSPIKELSEPIQHRHRHRRNQRQREKHQRPPRRASPGIYLRRYRRHVSHPRLALSPPQNRCP
jgi:3-phosphoshikimate 1-carboxyvinyltransferase